MLAAEWKKNETDIAYVGDSVMRATAEHSAEKRHAGAAWNESVVCY
jgi:hypothetical protein